MQAPVNEENNGANLGTLYLSYLHKISQRPCAPAEELPITKKAFLASLCSLLRVGLRLEISGRENLPAEAPFILCPNHQSHLDAFVLSMALPSNIRYRLCSFAARDHFSDPIIRFMSSLVGAILIERRSFPLEALRIGTQILSQKRALLIFPEGTRSRSGELGKFRRGASLLSLLTNCPIIPVHIDGTHLILPPDSYRPQGFKTWLKLKRHRIEVRFGAAHFPKPEQEDTKLLTSFLRDEIENLGTLD